MGSSLEVVVRLHEFHEFIISFFVMTLSAFRLRREKQRSEDFTQDMKVNLEEMAVLPVLFVLHCMH